MLLAIFQSTLASLRQRLMRRVKASSGVNVVVIVADPRPGFHLAAYFAYEDVSRFYLIYIPEQRAAWGDRYREALLYLLSA
jgi:hypothetical protein